jgi:Flp pilus assembly pilin Flp
MARKCHMSVTHVLLGEGTVNDTLQQTTANRYFCFGSADLARPSTGDETVIKIIRQLWAEESGQDVAEYAVMLAVILVIVIGTVRLIGTNANLVFSQVGSAMTPP